MRSMAWRNSHAWTRGYSDALAGKPEKNPFSESQGAAYGRGYANGAHKLAQEVRVIEEDA